MQERTFLVMFSEGLGWRVTSEDKLIAILSSRARATGRAVLAAKRFAAQGGVGIIRVLSKEGAVRREARYGKPTGAHSNRYA